MSEQAVGTRLAARLRELRLQSWPGITVTQKQLAVAIGSSVPLVSSWESPKNSALPSEDWLHAYARFFATRSSIPDVGPARLIADTELTEGEGLRRERLLDELLALREEALGGAAVTPEKKSFWHFPDGNPIRIVSSVLPDYEVRSQYTSRWHPNYIAGMRNADMDAAIELFGHVRAENPDTDVAFLTGDKLGPDVFASHLVLLGDAVGGTAGEDGDAATLQQGAVAFYVKRLDLPVFTGLPENGNPEYDSRFVVTTDDLGVPQYKGSREVYYTPKYVVDDRGRPLVNKGHPELEYDVALIARQPNPLNLATTVTICSGVFSRGTYGAVRALTDPQLRVQNEAYIASIADPGEFWLLTYVPVFKAVDGLETLTPDLNRPMHVLATSASLPD
jgi:hypothetical protein